MTELTFLLALTIAGTTVVVVATVIARAISGRGSARADLAEVKQELERQAAALADAETQVAELQERVDYTERLLAQARERRALEAGEKLEGRERP